VSWATSADGQKVVSQDTKVYGVLPGTPPPPGWPTLEEVNPQRRSAEQTIKANEYSAIFEDVFFK